MPDGVGGETDPVLVATGDAGESLEGSVVRVRADVVTSPSALTDGFSVDLDDGSGPVRVVLAAASGVTEAELPRRATVRVTGVLGQRQSGSSGGYRIPRPERGRCRAHRATADAHAQPVGNTVADATPHAERRTHAHAPSVGRHADTASDRGPRDDRRGPRSGTR